jgi:peptide/nickel transport system ATP-binding protein
MSDAPLLAVENLCTEFRTRRGVVRAVDDVSFEIPAGKTLGVVGESGCGKSVSALSIMRLVPDPPGRVTARAIRYRGQDLLGLTESRMRAIRGNRISMIFQEPMTSLNPVYTAGDQVAEAVRLHQGKSRSQALEVAVEMFKLVGIPSPENRVHEYPHQLSGGMRQRVMIAMALACRPDLLIADEPTTALDVTIQAQILDLLRSLQREFGMSIMLITHDLGVVAECADEVLVMYAGRVVERATTIDLFESPRHHYTAGLLRSVPSYQPMNESPSAPPNSGQKSAQRNGRSGTRPRLQEIPGMVPSLFDLPDGCKFQDRCSAVHDACRVREPALEPTGEAAASTSPSEPATAHLVRCHAPLGLGAGS